MRKALTEMTLQEKLGQLILTGLPGTEVDEEFIRLVREEKIGNVILFQYNQQEEQQIAALCGSLRELIEAETGLPPLIASDEEGGVVSRLPEAMGKMPSAMALAALEDPQAVYDAAFWTGRQLQSVGINFVLAPVLDVNNNLKNPVIGVRSFGQDVRTVSRLGREALRGFRDADILCAAKHFPGHGDTTADPHIDFARVSRSREELRQLELVPFRMAMEENVPAILIAHVALTEEDGLPATLSERVIRGMLREEMGFDGLAVSDCMEMDAICAGIGTAVGSVRSILAGMDLVCISRSADQVRATLQGLRDAVESGELPIEQVDRSVERVLACKARYAGAHFAWSAEDRGRCLALAEDLFTRSVAHGVRPGGGHFQLGDAPRFLSPVRQQLSLVTEKAARLSLAEELAAEFGGEARELPLQPDEAERSDVLQWASSGTSVVIGTLNATVYPEQMLLLEELTKLERPMACVTLRNPFELESLPERVLCIPVYEYSSRGIQQVCRYLRA